MGKNSERQEGNSMRSGSAEVHLHFVFSLVRGMVWWSEY